MCAVWRWIRDNSDPIVALATAIQAGAVIFAVTQVYLTKVQIIDARNALRANVELQIQHDGRDLLGSLKPEILSYIYGAQQQGSSTDADAQRKIIQILNYYASISRQHDIGAIEDAYWETSKKEFCFFVTRDHVKPIWDAAVKSGGYTQKFMEVGKQCSTARASTP